MANKVTIATVCSSNHYQYYVPIFCAACHYAYPNDHIKVFLCGKMKPEVKEWADKIKYVEIIEDYCLNIPTGPSIYNSLRFLLPKKAYKKCDYLFVRDVDIITLHHRESHVELFAKRMKTVNVPYYGVRGPYHYPKRPNITSKGWKKEFTRIAGGTVVFKSPEFFNVTIKMRRTYKKLLKTHGIDPIDGNKVCSYREFDEVMLYRIVKYSELMPPKIRSHGPDGQRLPRLYRDIHLGDYCKAKRTKKMKKDLPTEIIDKYKLLELSKDWQAAKAVSIIHPDVRTTLRRFEKHAGIK